MGEVTGEETRSLCCICYITGTSIPLSVNESPEMRGGNQSRCFDGLRQEEDGNGIGVSLVTISVMRRGLLRDQLNIHLIKTNLSIFTCSRL